MEKEKALTAEQMQRLSSEIYNISRRIRQIANGIDNVEVQMKLTAYIKQLNDIGTEVSGGVEVLMSKILRS